MIYFPFGDTKQVWPTIFARLFVRQISRADVITKTSKDKKQQICVFLRGADFTVLHPLRLD